MRSRLVANSQISGDFSTCTEMSKNGVGIGMAHIAPSPSKTQPDQRKVGFGFIVVASHFPVRRICVLHSAVENLQPTMTVPSGFVLPERCCVNDSALEPVDKRLCGGSRQENDRCYPTVFPDYFAVRGAQSNASVQSQKVRLTHPSGCAASEGTGSTVCELNSLRRRSDDPKTPLFYARREGRCRS